MVRQPRHDYGQQEPAPGRTSAVARRSVLAVAAGSAVAALAACTTPLPTGSSASQTGGSGGSPETPTTTTTSTPPPAPPVKLTPSVAAGQKVAVDTVVSVKATGGLVTDVVMTYQDPKEGKVNVEGTLSPDSLTWTAGRLLEPGTTYTLAMTGRNIEGVTATQKATFESEFLSLKRQIWPEIVADGATVGVAMPVVVRFDVPVQDKAAFQKRMKVTSTPAQPGSWGWVSSNEAHWRPVKYWSPGTKVSVVVDINSIPAGNGAYGQKSVSGGFTVGSPLTMVADLQTHQLTVTIDGQVARTIPVTGGKPGFATRSGAKVIMEKYDKIRMASETVGIAAGSSESYDIPDVKWAMRETISGEFLHAAPWSVGSQGRANVSHGCIGMSTSNAAWLYRQVKIGDPVVVQGTSRGLEAGNGWTDWNVSYEEWKKGSAL